MNLRRKIKDVALTIFIATSFTYILCIVGDLILGWRMYEIWGPLLPGFEWPLTASGFTIGLIWLVGYSIYTATILLIPYYLLTRKNIKGPTSQMDLNKDEGAI